MATLLAAGHSTDEISDILRHQRRRTCCRPTYSLKGILRQKFGLVDITFLQLYLATNCELRISAFDIDSTSYLLLDHRQTPHMLVSLAVKASSAVPFVNRPVRYEQRHLCAGAPRQWALRADTLICRVCTNFARPAKSASCVAHRLDERDGTETTSVGCTGLFQEEEVNIVVPEGASFDELQTRGKEAACNFLAVLQVS